MWNPLQPERQTTGLSPRTHISHPNSIYNPYDPKNMVAQLSLYNWCSGVDYVNGVGIADLHDYLFGKGSQVTTRQMGMTILQAVQYDPRKLKAKTLDNDRAKKMYVFQDPLDLKYGLEWMLSMWIWNLEWTYADLARQETKHEIMVEIFDELGSCESNNLDTDFTDRVWNGDLYEMSLNEPRPDWPALWAKFGWEIEPRPTAPTERVRSLKSLI